MLPLLTADDDEGEWMPNRPSNQSINQSIDRSINRQQATWLNGGGDEPQRALRIIDGGGCERDDQEEELV